MLRATLDQMRASAGRLAAAGIAIVLGTAFVAASLLATATMQQATHDAFTAPYADADLVVRNGPDPLTSDDIDEIRDIDGVAGADEQSSFTLEVTGSTATEYVSFSPTPSAPSLAIGDLAEGREATAPDEIVLSADVAERIGVTVSDSVTAAVPSAETDREERADLEVVGLLESTSSYFTSGANARIVPEQLAQWRTMLQGDDKIYGGVLIALDESADVEATRSAVSDVVPSTAQVLTMSELADQITAQQTGTEVMFLVLTLGFAAVALAVAGLVITNTFQVLVAQRTRTLALLRCVGASRRQIRGSVLTEAALLGLLASIAGLALGAATVFIGVRVLSDLFPESTIGAVPLHWNVPVVTLLIGIGVTVFSALVPARMATKVAPVAALRPIEGVVEPRSSRGRFALATTATVLGLGMLAAGVAIALAFTDTSSADLGVLGGLALGVVGGLISLTGLLLGSVFLVPRLLPVLGRLAGRGVPAQIATANAVRNPRRTAATTNALVIGVALVVMMSTGALSARQTLASELASSFPVDLTVQDPSGTQTPTEAQQDAVASQAGVVASVAVRQAVGVTITSGDTEMWVTLQSFTEGDPATVLRDPGVLDHLTDDVLLLSPVYAEGLPDDAPITLNAPDGTALTDELQVVEAELGGMGVAYVTDATMQELLPSQPITGHWYRLADDADVTAAIATVQQSLNEVTQADAAAPVLDVGGAAIERAAFGQVIDTLLTVVLGLLAVAVVIALVGVANTLSLSVLERRRENATLRAIGLTRRQLRSMLAIEGVLIAVVGAVIGVVAGLVYGWAGSAIVLGGFGAVTLGVPWPQLGAVLVIALVAGLLASVLPARSAVRQSPVAALATD